MFDLPVSDRFIHVSTPHYYHGGKPGETEEQFSARLAQELDDVIQREGPDTVAAFFAEPVMGAGGVIVPPAGYFEKVQAVLRKHDVLFVADEVICGFGRTGSYWGCQTFGITPDILVCAKALSASFLPISAVLVNDRVFQALADGSQTIGTWGHGFTYSGHPVPAAVAVETLKIYDEMDIVGHAKRVGAHMQKALRARFADHPLVGEVRGVGLVASVELAADKAAHKPFDAAVKAGPRLAKLAEGVGVILRAMVNDSMGFSPPLIITEAEVDEMVARTGRALDALTVQLRRESIAVV
jgi:4-aminobutyrate--pyruvate transaminase